MVSAHAKAMRPAGLGNVPAAQAAAFAALRAGGTLKREEAAAFLPDRSDTAKIYRMIRAGGLPANDLQPVFAALGPESTGRTLASLAALQELGLIENQNGRWMPAAVTAKRSLTTRRYCRSCARWRRSRRMCKTEGGEPPWKRRRLCPSPMNSSSRRWPKAAARMTLSWSTAPMPWPPLRTKASSAAAANRISATRSASRASWSSSAWTARAWRPPSCTMWPRTPPSASTRIRQKFGAQVALLVDGVTKLTQITFSNVEDRQAENLRKMLLAMSQDVRVMIIKLCDRLHNMRTGDAWPEQKRRDKALETMEVYAPSHTRLGISNIKEELEDRSLRYLDPVGYEHIRSLLNKHGSEFLDSVCETIRVHLQENGIHGATIRHRVKSIYGIYRKMYMQSKDFEEIYDVYAVRIIVDSVAECYTALGLIHDMYHPLPNRFKDYISTPKPNGYQSLHTTVIGREPIPFEVQIRTWDMDRMAEYGIAAHWKYKAGISGSDEKLEERLAWVRQLLESQRSSADAADLLSDIKSDLLPEEVFAFTPRGDVINLPVGATVIDFAYAIHSAVGNRMIGAKVNNRIVPIEHQVATGEIIEIITGPENRGPSRDWLGIVKTSEAKSKIRNWFKKERREENIVEGKDALEREMRRNMMTVRPKRARNSSPRSPGATTATRSKNSTPPSLRRAADGPHPAQAQG